MGDVGERRIELLSESSQGWVLSWDCPNPTPISIWGTICKGHVGRWYVRLCPKYGGSYPLGHINSSPGIGDQRRSDGVDLCEINYLGSLLIDFCVLTGKCSWLSPRIRAPLLRSRFKAGSSCGKAKGAFSMHYSKSISDEPRYFTSQRSTLSDLL